MSKALNPSAQLALLKPLASFCVRHGLEYQAIIKQLKQELIAAARNELLLTSETESVSRISLMTGVHRGEVERLLESDATQTETRADPIARIVGAWRNSKRFSISPGHPKPLTFQGVKSEFRSLINSVNKATNHYTVLRELERVEAVMYLGDRVVLKSNEYVPTGDEAKQWDLVGNDLADLVLAAEENITTKALIPQLHLKTEFDNLDTAKLDEIKKWFMDEGAALHERARRFLSAFDLDHHEPAVGNSAPLGGGRAAIGTFSFTSENKSKTLVRTRKPGRKKILRSVPTCVLSLFCSVSLATFGLIGCGGGTTGTSGTRTIAGTLRAESTSSVAALPMQMESDKGEEVISTTDSEGRFTMRAAGRSFTVTVGGTKESRSFTVQAALEAPSKVELAVALDAKNATVNKSLEVQPLVSKQCESSFEITNSIDQSSPVIDRASCAFQFAAVVDGVATEGVSASVACAPITRNSTSLVRSSGADGVILFGLEELSQLSCSSIVFEFRADGLTSALSYSLSLFADS